MSINFLLPPEVEQAISHGELAAGLGLARAEVDAVLKRCNVTEDLPTADELRDRLSELRKLAG